MTRRSKAPRGNGTAKAAESVSGDSKHRAARGPIRKNASKPLRVMKFGGTSVADASCIRKVMEIIATAARDSNIVVVVSAMNGVTSEVSAATARAEAGCRHAMG